ncbi:MAG TPA: hypothetical protein VH309_14465 [Elusimicrobiota bacterium]|jgi:hypothetical protein|nr:hypothetical protein [Elusimicrobiota bacterium]
MDTQNSSVVDVPNLKLAKVGKDRDRKRGGGGWLSARGAGSGFSGAVGGSGAGAGGLWGMSLGKILTILLVSGGISAGAWQIGGMMAASSSAPAPAAPKVFDTKDSGKYADTSGVIKSENSIPNSLGYVNDDGLTDAQRAAKKAADAAAAAKAAADAQAQADVDAKKKALEDAKAASATPKPDAAPEAAAPDAFKKALAGGKFGSMSSSFGGGGGGGGLSGGAGLSGGINRGFAAMTGLGSKGALTAFRAATKASSSRSAPTPHASSNSKGFAKQQLDETNGLSRTALASGQTESAAAGAGAPFDNNPNQGSVISGPGVGAGTTSGPADSNGSANPSSGGGDGGPISGGAACANANYEPDINGNCVTQTTTPTAQNAAPYQGLIDAAMILLGIIMILSVLAMIISKIPFLQAHAEALCLTIAALGAAVAAIGVTIATMTHGDFMIGAIIGAVGGFVAVTTLATWGSGTAFGATKLASMAAEPLIAAAVGELAAMSAKSGSMM